MLKVPETISILIVLVILLVVVCSISQYLRRKIMPKLDTLEQAIEKRKPAVHNTTPRDQTQHAKERVDGEHPTTYDELAPRRAQKNQKLKNRS
jgi:septation ring formation regulator EzrA